MEYEGDGDTICNRCVRKILKGLVKGLQHYWDQLEYWEWSGRLEETCCHSSPNEKPSANADVKKSQRSKTIIIMIIIIMWSTGNCERNKNLTILPNGMQKSESVFKNETHKTLWNFEIQMDDLIPVKRPDLVLFNNKKEIVIKHILLSRRTTNWK